MTTRTYKSPEYTRKVYINKHGSGFIVALTETCGINTKGYSHDVLIVEQDTTYITPTCHTYRFYDAVFDDNTYGKGGEVGLVFLPKTYELADFLDDIWSDPDHLLFQDDQDYWSKERLASISFGLANILCQYHD